MFRLPETPPIIHCFGPFKISTIHPIVSVRAQRILIRILYGGFNTRYYTLVHGFCFFMLFSIGCIGLHVSIGLLAYM